MTEDFIRSKGHMTLGSRFRRLGERLQADVQRLAKAEGINVPAGLWPVLGAIDAHGPLTIGGLTQALGISQPGVTRSVAELTRMGLVRSVRGRDDQRQRTAALTPKGAALVGAAKQDLWPRIEKAVAGLCGSQQGPLLDQLTALEAALDAMPLDRRAARPK